MQERNVAKQRLADLKAQRSELQATIQTVRDGIATQGKLNAIIEARSSAPRGASGGGSLRSSSTRASTATESAVERERQRAEILQAELELEQRLAALRGLGTDEAKKQADVEEAMFRLSQRLPELSASTLEADQARLKVLQDIVKATIDDEYRRDGEKKAAEDRAKAERDAADDRKRMADELAARQEQQVRTLANLYEDAFRGGTAAIWDDFKAIGLRVIAQVLAQFTLAQVSGGGFNLGSALTTAIGSVLPGFATGGSMVIGGRSGTDRNLLSINGQPVARVGRGEILSVTPRAAVGGGQTIVQPIIQVDARGAVMNDQFANMILSQAQRGAVQAAAAMGQAVTRNVPNRLSQFQRDGT